MYDTGQVDNLKRLDIVFKSSRQVRLHLFHTARTNNMHFQQIP